MSCVELLKQLKYENYLNPCMDLITYKGDVYYKCLNDYKKNYSNYQKCKKEKISNTSELIKKYPFPFF